MWSLVWEAQAQPWAWAAPRDCSRCRGLYRTDPHCLLTNQVWWPPHRVLVTASPDDPVKAVSKRPCPYCFLLWSHQWTRCGHNAARVLAVVLSSAHRAGPVPLTSNSPLSSPGGYSSQSNYNSPGSGQNYSGPPSSYQSSQGGYGRNADHSMNYQYR